MSPADPLKTLLSAEGDAGKDGEAFVAKVMHKIRRRVLAKQAFIMAAAGTAATTIWALATNH